MIALRGFDASVHKPLGVAHRIAAWILHEWLEILPPTIFFFVGFNFIVLTTNLLVAQYLVAVSNFMLALLQLQRTVEALFRGYGCTSRIFAASSSTRDWSRRPEACAGSGPEYRSYRIDRSRPAI
jgi:hypothetical protein